MWTRKPSKSWRSPGPSARRSAFTLIELLVVVAIIALLMSILMPSLRAAREQARTVVCGQRLRDLGNGLQTYFTENNGWIPGVNTSGVAARQVGTNGDLLNRPRMPVQSYDWITPIYSVQTEMKANWVERWVEILKTFGCPSQRTFKAVVYSDSTIPATAQAKINELQNNFTSVSYLMPAHFQYWGTKYVPAGNNGSKIQLGTTETGQAIYALTPATDWEAGHLTYKSMVEQVGNPGQKIAATDGTRYLETAAGGDELDFDVSPDPARFGSFTDGGAWWAGSTAYGVGAGSRNWSNRPVSVGSPSNGKNMELTYRHGPSLGGSLSKSARDNKGRIDALFFDGSVRTLTDQQSRNPVYWYPRGSRVSRTNFTSSAVMNDDLKSGDLIP